MKQQLNEQKDEMLGKLGKGLLKKLKANMLQEMEKLASPDHSPAQMEDNDKVEADLDQIESNRKNDSDPEKEKRDKMKKDLR